MSCYITSPSSDVSISSLWDLCPYIRAITYVCCFHFIFKILLTYLPLSLPLLLHSFLPSFLPYFSPTLHHPVPVHSLLVILSLYLYFYIHLYLQDNFRKSLAFAVSSNLSSRVPPMVPSLLLLFMVKVSLTHLSWCLIDLFFLPEISSCLQTSWNWPFRFLYWLWVSLLYLMYPCISSVYLSL